MPDYDMDYYGDYSTSSIVKQLTKESLTVQRRVSCQNKQTVSKIAFSKLARTIAQRNDLRHEKTKLTKKLNSILDFVTQYEGSSENYADLAALVADLEGTTD